MKNWKKLFFCGRVSSWVHEKFEWIFGWWGFIVGKFPYIVMPVSFFVLIIWAVGFIRAGEFEDEGVGFAARLARCG